MSMLYNCGLCCVLISCWGFVQLLIMGICIKAEAIAFLEDVIEEEYTDFDDLIKKTTENFRLLAINCWIAAGIYAVMIGVSYFCMVKAKSIERNNALKLGDDVAYCENKSKVI